jgi:hypothetical protein
VKESKERVRAALLNSGFELPPGRITVNLAPADLPKEGSHYDLPIALGLMAAIGANTREEGLICPAACGAEAAWASPDIQIIAANSLIQIANHFKGTQVLSRPQPKVRTAEASALDLRDIKGQESEGPGERQARAGNRCGRRTSPPDDRRARRRQVDVGGAAALDPAAAVAARASGSLDDRLRRRRDRGRRADVASAVPQRACSIRCASRSRTARSRCPVPITA